MNANLITVAILIVSSTAVFSQTGITEQVTVPPATNAQATNAQVTNAQVTNAQVSNAQVSNAQVSNAQVSNAQVSNQPGVTGVSDSGSGSGDQSTKSGAVPIFTNMNIILLALSSLIVYALV